MLRKARLAGVIKEIDFSGMSRNKNFDAYKDPLVREARERLNRVQHLADIMSRKLEDGWDFVLSENRDRHGLWTLTGRNPKLDALWTAKLQDYELDILKHYSRSPALRS